MQSWKLYKPMLDTRGIENQRVSAKRQRLRKACTEFESIFIHYMLKTMRNSIVKSHLLHSKYEDIYNSLINQQISLYISKAGGIGIGEMLYNQLKTKVLGEYDDKK